MSKELRVLTPQEVIQLVNSAPSWSRDPVIAMGDYITFFDKHAVAMCGLVIDNKPVYCGFLIPINGIYGLWTIIEKDSKHQHSIYKAAKKVSHAWSDIFGKVYSYTKPEFVNWVKKMGFKTEGVEGDYTILSLTKKEELCTVGSM